GTEPAGARNVCTPFLYGFRSEVAQGSGGSLPHLFSLPGDFRQPSFGIVFDPESYWHLWIQILECLLDCFLVALCADGGDGQGISPVDAIELVGEFKISRDLPWGEHHCIIGRETMSDEGGDADADFRKRTLWIFAPSSVRLMSAVNCSMKEPKPFG